MNSADIRKGQYERLLARQFGGALPEAIDVSTKSSGDDYTRLIGTNRADGKPSVYLYGYIDDWMDGVSSIDFVKAVNSIDSDTIHLRIDSGGGITHMAIAMMAALREHPARAIAHIDGMAASAATIVMLGCDEVIASPQAEILIHNCVSIAFGDRFDFAKAADRMALVDSAMVDIYAGKTGRPRAEIQSLMHEDRVISAIDALNFGLIDSIAGDDTDDGEGGEDTDDARAQITGLTSAGGDDSAQGKNTGASMKMLKNQLLLAEAVAGRQRGNRHVND